MKPILILLILVLISGCQSKEDVYFSPNTTQATINETNETQVNQTEININETNETEPTGTCLDTDNGQIYGVRGTTVVSNGKLRQVQDYCENTGTLVEYYCKEDNKLGIEAYECFNINNVCSNGVCGELNTTNTTNSTNN